MSSETKYYSVVVFNAIAWQCFLGAIGVIFCASSLLSGIVIAAGLPITEVLAVIFCKENFKPERVLPLHPLCGSLSLTFIVRKKILINRSGVLQKQRCHKFLIHDSENSSYQNVSRSKMLLLSFNMNQGFICFNCV